MEFVGWIGHSDYRTTVHYVGSFGGRYGEEEKVIEDRRYGCQHAFVYTRELTSSLNHKVAIVELNVRFP